MAVQERPGSGADWGALREQLELRRHQLRLRAAGLRARLPHYPPTYLYLLMGVTAVDASDRALLATVFEDIKRDFGVTDTELGILLGAYATLAALSVIPFGYLADRVSRVKLIAFGFLPWALAQFWSAGAATFGGLFMARMFLGTIEATNGPSTPSLIGDYYSPERRSRSLSLHLVGSQVGAIFGFVVGGTVASTLGWRPAFVLFGVLGLYCGLAVIKSLPEPQRGLNDSLHRTRDELREVDGAIAVLDSDEDPSATEAGVSEPQLSEFAQEYADKIQTSDVDYRRLTPREMFHHIVRVRTLWVLVAANGVNDFFMASLGVWVATFFRRYHGLTGAEAGLLLAFLTAFMSVGVIVGGRYGDRFLAQGRPDHRILLMAGAYVAQFVFFMLMFAPNNLWIVVVATACVALTVGVSVAPAEAVGLDIFVAHLRGRSMALRSLVRVSFTAGAPIVFGIISDSYGLRSAWLFTIPTLLASAAITLIALRTYKHDKAYAELESVRQHRLEIEEALATTQESDEAGEIAHLAELDELDELDAWGDGALTGSGPGRAALEHVTIPEYHPPRRPPTGLLGDRLAGLWQEVTATRLRTSLLTLSAVAAATAGFAARGVSVLTADEEGPLRVSCNIDTFLFGHANPAVHEACRSALAARSVLFIAAVAVLAVAAVGLLRVLVVRSRKVDGWLATIWDELTSSPLRRALSASSAIAAFVLLLSARPVMVEALDAQGHMAAHCGIDTWLLGHPNPTVQEACRAALGGQAVVFVVSLMVLLVGGVGALRLLFAPTGRIATTARTPPARAMVALGTIAVVALVAMLFALRPVAVETVDRAGHLVAHCGMDTFLLGHPNAAVLEACRNALRGQAAVFFTAFAVFLTTLAYSLSSTSRRRFRHEGDGSEARNEPSAADDEVVP